MKIKNNIISDYEIIKNTNGRMYVYFYNQKTKKKDNLGAFDDIKEAENEYAKHEIKFYYENPEYLDKGIKIVKRHEGLRYHIRVGEKSLGIKTYSFKNYKSAKDYRLIILREFIDL